MTLREMARDNLVAAKSLLADGRWRSAVSRAYYAAYSETTAMLRGRASFPEAREGPSHDKLPKLIMTYLAMVRLHDRRQIATAAHRMYMARIDADYVASATVTEKEARSAVQDASWIVRRLANAD